MKLTINNHEIETQDYVDKWVNWALEETTATDEQIIENVQWLYEHAKLSKPEVKVFRDYDIFLRYIRDNKKTLSDSVRDSVRDSVWNSVRDSVWDSVWVSVFDSVGDSVRDSVRDSVWFSVRDSVRDSVWVSVWVSVRDSVRDSVFASVGAWYCVDYMAFADVFADCNILGKEKKQELEKIKKVLSTQRVAVYSEDVCYVLVAPAVHRNDRGRLHNESGLAVDWSGTGLYYLHGIEFSKEWHTKIVHDELSPEEILAIDNVEHRRIAWQYMNKKKLEGLKGFKILEEQTDEKGNPMRIIQFEHPDAGKVKYYNCFCPTTKREYYLGTEEKTCKEAKAASFGFSADEIQFVNEW